MSMYDQKELDSEQRRIQYNTGFDAAMSIYKRKCKMVITSPSRDRYEMVCQKCKSRSHHIGGKPGWKFCSHCGAEITEYVEEK